ncbi:MAG TPA: hypothetical protein VEM41_01860 [Actinomycetota bacterium]|nr:hypothetical protein [Actinomycetota bacterium]
MGTHLAFWVVGIGSVTALVAWLFLVAGAEGERLGSDLECRVPGRPAAPAAGSAPRPDRAPGLRRVADPEYGLMILSEPENGDWDQAGRLPASAMA